MTEIQNIGGEWQFFMGAQEGGETVLPAAFTDTMMLPGTTSSARKGEKSDKREVGYLTDEYPFEGFVWFQRTVDLRFAAGKNLFLFLERTRITTLFVDGAEIGTRESLCTPHRYDLTAFAGGVHTLVIRVANIGYKTRGGHLTSPDTQTNWNGITGRIELQAFGGAYLTDVKVTASAQTKSARITAKAVGAESGVLTVSAACGDKHTAPDARVEFASPDIAFDYFFGEDALLWDEYAPDFYTLRIALNGDVFETAVGLRDFKAAGDKFTVNGRKTFLRGKHDGMIFPRTGYAPTEVGEWLRVMKTAQDYGMNHYRFHTCCPPEAAFIAADMLGIYMEPELPFWGTIAAPGEEQYNEAEQAFLISEGLAMLREFGNHPSFCMISMGNELWGNPARINEIMGILKQSDDRPLYTQGSNNFQFIPNALENDDFFCGVRLSKNRLIRGSYAMCDAPLGHVLTEKPSTAKDYDSVIAMPAAEETTAGGKLLIQYGTTMKEVDASEATEGFNPTIPIVTHEIGQYETYPDYRSIEKFNGVLKAKNLEVFRERLTKAGLLELADDYFKASGALAVACYQEEMEAVFRSKLLAGFQILDIQDFTGQGTALVGVLDAFMESKGLVSPEAWRSFCSDAVLTARFDSYVYESEAEFHAKIGFTTYRRESFDGARLTWSISDGNSLIAGNEYEISHPDGENYLDVCEISARLPFASAVRKLRAAHRHCGCGDFQELHPMADARLRGRRNTERPDFQHGQRHRPQAPRRRKERSRSANAREVH
ncbi:MAG: beta-glucuronidase [Oscillospiraceae bacterium]